MKNLEEHYENEELTKALDLAIKLLGIYSNDLSLMYAAALIYYRLSEDTK